jgi:DNA-binding transcriptional ArsR family regulator
MSSNRALPDYELDDVHVVTGRAQVRAMFHPLRGLLLDLLLERAATVAEMAAATSRPPSTVAYHVGVLVDAGLLRVVSTRKVRGVVERSYGRTARVFYVGRTEPGVTVPASNPLRAAAAEAAPAAAEDRVRSLHRHARIPDDRVREFWAAVMELAQDFSASARGGDTTYAFVAALYPADYPALPERTT